MHIKLTAAFQGEEQPDFESLGISPSEDDFDSVLWDDLYVMYDGIAAMHKNSNGDTNVFLFNGQKWSVKESPEEITALIKDVVSNFSLPLLNRGM